MNGHQAGRHAHQLRQLLRAGTITPHVHAVGDAMLFSLRQVGQRGMTASYALIAKAANVSRRLAIDAVKQLTELWSLRKGEPQKTWQRWTWRGTRCEGRRWTANLYHFEDGETAETRMVQGVHPAPIASFKKIALEHADTPDRANAVRTLAEIAQRRMPQILGHLKRRMISAGATGLLQPARHP